MPSFPIRLFRWDFYLFGCPLGICVQSPNVGFASKTEELNASRCFPLCPRYCCKSRKSNDTENLAKADFWPAPPLQYSAALVGSSVVVLCKTMWSHISPRAKRISGPESQRDPRLLKLIWLLAVRPPDSAPTTLDGCGQRLVPILGPRRLLGSIEPALALDDELAPGAAAG